MDEEVVVVVDMVWTVVVDVKAISVVVFGVMVEVDEEVFVDVVGKVVEAVSVVVVDIMVDLDEEVLLN